MARNVTCGLDQFAASLEDLLGDIPESASEGADKAVRSSVRKGAKHLRGEATAGIGRHPWSDEYRSGFTSHVTKNGLKSEGEIGNKAKPGLVHLLEKGHATPTGRRTGAFRHMEPTFDYVKDDFYEQVAKNVGEALS